jgi:hypothetical protein
MKRATPHQRDPVPMSEGISLVQQLYFDGQSAFLLLVFLTGLLISFFVMKSHLKAK